MIEENIKYWGLIVKDKDGTLNNDESLMLDSWKKEKPAQYRELIQIYQNTTSQELSNFNPADQWNDLQTMIKIEEEARAGKTIKFFPWIARAAAAALIILGVIYIYNYQSSISEDLLLQTMISTNDNGQKQIELPDGTIVWMNKNSELLYPEKFDTNTREIYLKGEAFFDVAHNKEKPFIIHAGISKTTVLGTSFNLRAYGKEDDIRLTVVSGKVAFTLTDDRERVIVTPGNMANLDRGSKIISKDKNHDLNFLSWKTNELKFDDCSISELLYSLERHYDTDIRVEYEGTKQCRFTGDFKDTELDNALKIITRAIGSTYQKKGDSYLILGEGCN